MSIYVDSREILTNVLTNKEPYDVSLNNFLQLNVRSTDELEKIKDIYDGFFDKFYYFQEITKENLTKVTNLLIATIGIAFVSLRNLKMNNEEVFDFVNDTFNKNKEILSPELKDSLINYKNGNEYVFKNVISGSKEYLSIVFNVPVWFISMILNQNGKEITKNILTNMTTSKKKYYILNSLENIDEKDKNEFAKFKTKNNSIYECDEPQNPLIQDLTFVEYNPFYEKIFKNLPSLNNKYVSLYSEIKDRFYVRFLNEYLYKNNVINLAFSNLNENKDAINEVTLRKIKDAFVFESTVGELVAHLTYQQDLIFYLPDSTNMTKFFLQREYRVNFDQNSIDKFIGDEANGLQEISTHVANKGYLVYLINTIDKKEGTRLVQDFLANNNEFSLIKEEEIIPNKINKTFVYYAIIKRVIHA
jgi:hypothetical protein